MLVNKPAHDESESGGRSSTTLVTALLPSLNSRTSGHGRSRAVVGVGWIAVLPSPDGDVDIRVWGKLWKGQSCVGSALVTTGLTGIDDTVENIAAITATMKPFVNNMIGSGAGRAVAGRLENFLV